LWALVPAPAAVQIVGCSDGADTVGNGRVHHVVADDALAVALDTVKPLLHAVAAPSIMARNAFRALVSALAAVVGIVRDRDAPAVAGFFAFVRADAFAAAAREVPIYAGVAAPATVVVVVYDPCTPAITDDALAVALGTVPPVSRADTLSALALLGCRTSVPAPAAVVVVVYDPHTLAITDDAGTVAWSDVVEFACAALSIMARSAMGALVPALATVGVAHLYVCTISTAIGLAIGTLASAIQAVECFITAVVTATATLPIGQKVEILVHLPVAVIVPLVAFFFATRVYSAGGIVAVLAAADAGSVSVFVTVKRRERTGTGCRIAETYLAQIVRQAILIRAARWRSHTAAFGRAADLAFAATGVGRHIHAHVVRAPVLGAFKRVRAGGRSAGAACAVRAHLDAVAEVAVLTTCVRGAGADGTFAFATFPISLTLTAFAFSLVGERGSFAFATDRTLTLIGRRPFSLGRPFSLSVSRRAGTTRELALLLA